MLRAFEQRLAARREQQCYRQRLVRDSSQGVQLQYSQRHYLNFCSNDYLGLAADPRVVNALHTGASCYGVGSGASQLITGHCAAHQDLEQAFAKFMGYERALLFGNGMMANIGVITALFGKQDTVFSDKLNHASLIDAVRLSGAHSKRYPHLDTAHLAGQIAASRASHKVIVSDGVFSMNGAMAPLPELSQLAGRHDALLMIDDAHGIGVLGKHGRGIVEHFKLSATEVPILICPLGKAFGGYGAIVLSHAPIIENLLQFARSYIYTTALPPALAVAMRTSLEIVTEETWRREKLQQLIRHFKEGALARNLPVLDSATPIQGLVLGSADTTVRISEMLWRQGIMVTAIRPPTVAKNTARLRITLTALHEPGAIEQLLEVLAAAYATLH